MELAQVQLLKRHKQSTTTKGTTMTEMPDASMLMSMVRDSRAGFVDNKWDELLALVDDQARTIQGIHEVIANMKSNLGSHATFIEQLEVLVGNGDQL